MSKMLTLTIDGKTITCPEGTTILEAAKQAHIDIPTLCYMKDINEIGACRMCLVEVQGMRTLQASCVYPVFEGMVVNTRSKRVREARKMNLELILSNHQRSCLTCLSNNHCELRVLAGKLGIHDIRFDYGAPNRSHDTSNPSIERNNNKCILCRRCVAVCKHIQKVEAIETVNRGMDSEITTAFGRGAGDAECILCGQCITVCPTGALREKISTDEVWDALGDPTKHVVVQIAPAVRAAIGEEFGYPMGTNVLGKMVAATRKLGFDKVFDTNTGADLTIMEEGTELLNRLNNGGTLPMITSCSPGWIKYCEHFFPEMIPNLSTCKSPHMMFGAMIKSHYAQKMGIDPKDIVMVSVMPCVAKKFEVSRPEMEVDGIRDVDYVLTTRELARMIKEASINFQDLADEEFDNPFAAETGAAVIFGVTGGVMEAALRTVAEKVAGRELDSVDFIEARGKTGTKEIAINAGGITLKGLVVSGVGNAKEVLTKIRENGGQSEYHFIEVMGCPGGCIMGGGQPKYDTQTRENVDVFAKRSSVLYGLDRTAKIRKSHQNPDITKLYEEWLGEPNSHVAHKFLHTSYVDRGRYGKTDI